MEISLKTLAKRSFAVNKVRNLAAVLAIMLTAVLFTTVTTIGKGALDSLTLAQQMVKMSKSDGDFRYMTEKQFNRLNETDFIKSYGLRMPVAFLADTDRHNIEFDVMDDVQAELTFSNPGHGNSPAAADEVVASDLALQELGVEAEVGAFVPVEFSVRGQTYTFPMRLTGWYEAINEQVSVMWTGTAFRDAHPEIFQYTYNEDREMAGTYFSDFTAVNSLKLQDKMNAWVYSVGGDPENIQAENYVCAAANTVTNAQIDRKTIQMGVIILILFILCGYLLIYNVFDIAVMQEIRRYGLYRTIGMSKRQVRKLINCQAVWLSGVGIFLGMLIGFFTGKAALPIVMNTVSKEYENLVVNVSPSPVIFLGAAVLTALTVFLSTRKPIRVAADTPPVEAYHFVEKGLERRKARRKFSDAKIWKMAWSNLGRNIRRTVFIVLSLALCIVLLNSVGIAARSLDVEKKVDYMIRTDFAVVNKDSTNIQKGFTRREQGLSKKTIEDISRHPGIYDDSVIYKNTLDDMDVTYDFGARIQDTEDWREEGNVISGITDDGFTFPLGNDGRALCNVYGMSELYLSRMDIREGETDTKRLYEKMLKGQGIVVGVLADRSTMLIDKDFDFTGIGDTITVYKNGNAVMELPVLAKAALNGDDQEIGVTANGAIEVGGDSVSLFLPYEIYTRLYDEPVVYKYSFNVKEGKKADMVSFLEKYISTKDTSIDYMSDDSARRSAEENRTMISFVGGLIGVIFGVIGVLNLINTVITTIIARRHEFATMQSIGMTDRQLERMTTYEGIYYAAGAGVLGLLVSALLGFTVVRELVGGIWYFSFRFTLIPALVSYGILFVTSAAVPSIALYLFNKGSIVEKLRVTE